jgi:hypothetical protein
VVFRRSLGLHMSCHVADAIFPFYNRVRETHTKRSGRILNDSLAAITLIDNRVAATSIELASSFGHKDALNTFLYRCTNHDNHILSL